MPVIAKCARHLTCSVLCQVMWPSAPIKVAQALHRNHLDASIGWLVIHPSIQGKEPIYIYISDIKTLHYTFLLGTTSMYIFIIYEAENAKWLKD